MLLTIKHGSLQMGIGGHDMKWFTEVFLPSFKAGETRITEKQFMIFARYLTESFSTGTSLNYKGVVNGKKIWAQEWVCKGGTRWYVTVEEA